MAPRSPDRGGRLCRGGPTGGPVSMRICAGEPPVGLPANWDPATHARFDTILTWNDRYAGAVKFRKFCWPVTQRFPRVEPVPFARKKLLVNISANKRSDHPQDLYRARRAAIRPPSSIGGAFRRTPSSIATWAR